MVLYVEVISYARNINAARAAQLRHMISDADPFGFINKHPSRTSVNHFYSSLTIELVEQAVRHCSASAAPCRPWTLPQLWFYVKTRRSRSPDSVKFRTLQPLDFWPQPFMRTVPGSPTSYDLNTLPKINI